MAHVRLLGLLRARAGTADEAIPAATVREVLTALVRRHPALAGLLFPTADGRLNRDVAVLVNGRNIAFLQELDTPLASEDVVTLFYHGVRGFPGG